MAHGSGTALENEGIRERGVSGLDSAVSMAWRRARLGKDERVCAVVEGERLRAVLLNVEARPGALPRWFSR